VKKRILLVEDEPNILISLIFLLEHAGFDVSSETDGLAGLELILRSPPNVVVLDVMLPGLDGFEILKALRSNQNTASLPILMLTAKGQSEDRNNATKFGADKFISKPFSNAEVVSTIKKLAGVDNDEQS
jgi:two-component system OmpR family response regulator